MIKENFIKILTTCILLLTFSGCAHFQATASSNGSTPLVEAVLTQEQRDSLTPDDILNSLKQGNQRFMDGTLTIRDHSKQVRDGATGQYPKAIVLSCIDSRLPVEDVFDRGIGDLFVARVAGNFENTDILGSMEFACKVSGAKLILVLGHEYCGAIQGAIDNVELGNITAMLKNIQPAIKQVDGTGFAGNKTSENEAYVHEVAEQNVWGTMDNIRKYSPILKAMEDNKEIKIVGGMYDMNTGQVTFME
ncbi:carbonic anhydrase family protein [Methyloprofundus sp.]|uniref:carbonic anhydrase family protein n=1 Tax=Methyloprofundus sp. TaxID=2020875 RepID=UPI003D0B35BB